jgi:hypothetical protein
MRGLDDVRAWLSQVNTGTAETAGAPFWRVLARYRPDVRVVTIRRPVAEVVDSLMAIDMQGVCSFDRQQLAAQMKRLDAKLDQIEARYPGVLSVRFEDLANEAACSAVFEHCLPYQHDQGWWAAHAEVNIQVSMPALMRYAIHHRQQLDKFIELARQNIVSTMSKKSAVEADGMAIRQEPFDKFLSEAETILREHSRIVSGSKDFYLEKNIPLMRNIDKSGNMQITTARSNGRLFGYLITLISPSLERENEFTAVDTAFYASPDCPGLGRRLMNASVQRLKNRGVHDLFLRKGVHESAPKLETLFRRAGAVPCGELFHLDLRAS